MNIKEIRTSLELSKAEFAGKLDVMWTTVDRWESGKCKPRKRMLEKVFALQQGLSLHKSDEMIQVTLLLKKSELKRLLTLGLS